MSDPRRELQIAMRAALLADEDIANIVGDMVLERFQSDEKPPHINIGEYTDIPWDTKDGAIGVEATMSVHYWSIEGDSEQISIMMSHGRSVLHRAALSVSGWELTEITCEYSSFILDQDGVTWHGIQRFRTLMTATA